MEINADRPAPNAALLGTLGLDALRTRTTDNVRQHPTDARERWLLFELLCLDGEWERALRQLQTWAALKPDGEARAQMYRVLIQSEAFRTEVFAGRRTPGAFDLLPPWMDRLTQANAKLADGDLSAADVLRTTALDNAPTTAGESPQMGKFAWLTDSDSRLGPTCELVVSGGYRWLPFDTMKSLTFGPVAALTDLVWRSIVVVLRDATVLRGYMPARYPGSEHGPATIKLAQRTTWTDVGETGVLATGQKTWSTDRDDFGVLAIGECRFFDHAGD